MDKNKKYWLVINSAVFYSKTSEDILLYHTKNGQYVKSKSREIKELVDSMHDRQALGVVQVGKKELTNKDVYDFICDAIEKQIFKCLEIEKYPQRPIQLMPVLNLQKDIDKLTKRDQRLIGDSIGRYLLSATLFLNGDCEKNCKHCDDYYKQFTHCSKNLHKQDMDLDLVQNILNAISPYVDTVAISGANILQYKYLKELVNFIQHHKINAKFYIHYQNIDNIAIKQLDDYEKHILIHFPLTINTFDIPFPNTHFHFVISSDSDYQEMESMIHENSITNYSIHPFYDSNNIKFFEDNVFLNEDDIFYNPVAQKKIFANQKLNSIFFGNVYIFANGDVYTNANVAKLGNIKETSLLDLIYKEMLENTSWRMLRDKQPCSECVYQYLCPSPSNYELAIGKMNLCNVV